MKLLYRGINHSQDSVFLSSNQVKAVGKYRGKNVELHRFSNILLQQHPNPMTYRGVTYR